MLNRTPRRLLLLAASAALAGAGCGIGGGGGGGPSPTPLPPQPEFHGVKVPTDAVAYGKAVYLREGCRLCHGEAGQGGVANANSDTGGKINGLTLVKEGYSIEQLVEKISEGVTEVGQADAKGPTPPLRMPPYGHWLTAPELQALAAYLVSLYPADREAEDSWDDEDDEDEAPAPAKPAPAKPGPQGGAR